MPKVDVKMSCGHEDVVLFVNKEKTEYKIDYLQKKGICCNCRKKWREEKEGVKVNIKLYNISKGTFVVVYNGDTKTIKEKLKEDGFKWNSCAWEKAITASEIDEELEKAEKLGANPDTAFSRVCVSNEGKLTYLHVEALAEILALKEPKMPKKINGYWNGTFYGKNKNEIYIDKQKVILSSEDIEEYNQYVIDKEEYLKNFKDIVEWHNVE